MDFKKTRILTGCECTHLLSDCYFKKYVFYFLLMFLLLNINCTKDLIIKEKEKKRKKHSQIISEYDSTNWEERLEVINEITDSDIKNSVQLRDLIIKATYDIHTSVKIKAISRLSVSKSSNALERITEIAKSRSNSNERWFALKTLSQYRDKSSIQVFLSGMKSKDWLIREISIMGILKIKLYDKKKMIPYIIRALNDRNETVRIATLNNLDVKDKRLYKEIIKAFNRKKYKKNRNIIILVSLKAMKGYKLDDKTRNLVINLLTDTNKDIRLLALKVLKLDQNQTVIK